MHYPPPPGNAEDTWREVSGLIAQYDAERCAAYREEIDTVLIFAGLFSAVVTAFSIESYKWLQPAPGDLSAQLLLQVVQLLSPNQTSSLMPQPPPSLQNSLPPAVAARVNAYWYLSLSLSLISALVGILCKQWVREYARKGESSPKQGIGIRQTKFEGFEAWRVGEMISLLPLLLQLALWLFLLGIIEFLWHLNFEVALAVVLAAGFALIFYIATSVLPLCQYAYLLSARWSSPPTQCPYKSPLAWVVLRLFSCFIKPNQEKCGERASRLRRLGSWKSFDHNYNHACDFFIPSREPDSYFRALSWSLHVLAIDGLRDRIWHCLWDQVQRWVPHRHLSNPVKNPGIVLFPQRDNGTSEYLAKSGFVELFQQLDARGDYEALSWASILLFSCSTASQLATRLELFIRCVPRVDPFSAYAMIRSSIASEALADPHTSQELSSSLLQCAAAYFKVWRQSERHATERHGRPNANQIYLGHFLVTVARLIDRAPRNKPFFACICALFSRWQRTQPPNRSLDNNPVVMMVQIILQHVWWYRRTHAPYMDTLDRSQPHVDQLAEVVKLANDVFQSGPEELPAQLFYGETTLVYGLADMQAIYRGLLEIVPRGGTQFEASAGAESS